MTATIPTALPMTHLVDPHCGVVRAVRDFARLPGLPEKFISCVADVADTRRFADWPTDRIAAGTAFGDREVAWSAAVGEAVERYCGNNVPPDLPVATSRQLTDAGVDHTPPAELPAFHRAQFDRPGFPYLPFTADAPVRWATGRLPDGAPIRVPAGLVYLNYHRGPRRDDPRTHHLNYTGIATGVGPADATDRGLAECLERDAMTTWWLLDRGGTPVDPDSVPGLRADLSGCPFDLRLVALPSDFGPAVIGALVVDRANAIPAAGFSANVDPVRAVRKAVLEALQVWIATHGLLEPDGPSRRAVAAGIFHPRAYLPHRPERDYLTVAGDHFGNVRDLAAQTQLWLDRRLHPLADRFTGRGPAIPVDAVPTSGWAETRQRLAAAGHRVITVDVTTPDVAETGLTVMRVLVTGLQPNSPAAFPYLGTQRLARLAAAAGRPAPAPWTVTLAPPPHN